MTRVYTLASGKWSTFDRPHHGIFEVKRPLYKLDTAAYMDVFGFMHRWGPEKKNIEKLPVGTDALGDAVWRTYTEPTPRSETDEDGNTVIVGVVDIHLNTEPYTVASTGIYELVEREYSDTVDIEDIDMDPDWAEI